MSCFEFIFNKNIGSQEISRQLTEIYNLSKGNIVFLKKTEGEPLPKCVRLWFTLDNVEGDFFCHLSLYVKDPSLIVLEKDLAVKLCMKNKMQGLISDEGDNPYKMVFVSDIGVCSIVSLDAEALDNEKYFLAKK